MFLRWGYGGPISLGIPMYCSGGHGHAFLRLFFVTVGVLTGGISMGGSCCYHVEPFRVFMFSRWSF